MTLIISLRIPDGIVIAGDSLSTMMAEIHVMGEVDVICPNCGHQHKVGPTPINNFQFPSTTFSYAQKIFPFMGRFGIGIFGLSQYAGKTAFFIVRELEQEIRENGSTIKNVSEAANTIGTRLHELLKQTIPSIDDASDDWKIGGVQVVGYDDNTAKTIEVSLGKQISQIVSESHGCTYSGQGDVVRAIWDISKKNPGSQTDFGIFSLQDAMHYAEFLIGTTASFQQFSRTIPQVGGEIDIALVTPFTGFRWIKQKELGKIIGDDYEHQTECVQRTNETEK